MESEETKLEIALRRAIQEPAHRPEFYRLLVDSQIVVLGHCSTMRPGEFVLNAGGKVHLMQWQREDGKPVYPFFSSMAAVQRAFKLNDPCIGVHARDFFELTRGSNLVLNPNSTFYREFHPEEIASILSTGMPQAPEPINLEIGTPIRLEQPSEDPVRLIAALSLLLAKHSNVHAAYLALMTVLGESSSQSLIVGILGDGNMDRVIVEANSVIADTKPVEMPFDIVIMQPGEKVFMSYFITIDPFYERSWGAKMNSCLGSGRA